jgi:hypothetical protein
MRSPQLRAPLLAWLIMLAAQLSAFAQALPPAATASSPSSCPQIPLKRNSDSNASMLGSLGWTGLLLAAGAAAAFVGIGRKRTGKVPGLAWLRSAVEPGTPKPLGRTILTPHSSLHVVEWNGEELLLGCTPHSVSLLVRRARDLERGDATRAETTDKP